MTREKSRQLGYLTRNFLHHISASKLEAGQFCNICLGLKRRPTLLHFEFPAYEDLKASTFIRPINLREICDLRYVTLPLSKKPLIESRNKLVCEKLWWIARHHSKLSIYLQFPVSLRNSCRLNVRLAFHTAHEPHTFASRASIGDGSFIAEYALVAANKSKSELGIGVTRHGFSPAKERAKPKRGFAPSRVVL